MPFNPHAAGAVALITGAVRPRGIGFETARQLGRLGIQVVLTARDPQAAEAHAAELHAEGLKVRAQAVDVTDAGSVERLAQWLRDEVGRVDILVNNAAGIASYGEPAASADLTQARHAMEATLFGTWRITQALLALLLRSPHPSVVNVSSGAGSHGDGSFGLHTANAMGPGYAVAKAALNALTAKLAGEHQDAKLRINAVCPGFTATFDGAEQLGARPVHDGAAGIVWAALLPDDGPTGGSFRDGCAMPW
jgi:NAD(P)-dependent dehydrogenase (short-subunit alcohol dehydrogenase family)